ncbi:C4-dicarboxylate ABC transporter [Gordonibacter sp. An230]|uniref:YfcC family protein n=1 Tax=Gordonibacter sp. An230 TaxID=1965592 RepID=UPI000B3AB430|nr:YfcC family protein [Gordonibacter sp. An230]OUO89690.1 C4-dicarboxylate ABC transporter [Gordonibacter sp. An230]
MAETTANEAPKKRKKKRRAPDSFIILVACLIAVALATVIASLFTDQVTGATFADVVTAPVLGFSDAMQVCVFVLVLGGFLAMVNKTGALDAGVATLVRSLKGHELVLIPILMLLFGICGSTYGMMEETVPFYILLAATMYAAGFDTLTGALVVLLGAGAGCIGSTVNPFSVGVATAALTDLGIAVDQGLIIGFGLVLFVVAEAISIFFVMRYAKKVMADKGSTFMSLQEQQDAEKEYGQMEEGAESPSLSAVMSGKQKVVLVLFALTFVVMIIGFVPWQNFGIDLFMLGGSVDNPSGAWSAFLTGTPLGSWYFNEATAWFLLMAIVIGVLARLSGKDIVGTFLGGCAEMVSVALVIALARSVAVIMGETQLDTFILTNAANALSGVPAFIFAPATFLFYFVLSFAIPSSSGMATLAMPIMGPLSSDLGFSPEVMVMIYVAAHGIVAIITPMNGAVLAGLALAKVQYATMLKAVMKVIVVTSLACVVLLTAAMLIL